MAYQRRVQGEQTVIINADDAEARGIEKGQPVRVLNDRGELQAVARIGPGEHHGVDGVVRAEDGDVEPGPGT